MYMTDLLCLLQPDCLSMRYWRLKMPCHTNKSASSWNNNFLKRTRKKRWHGWVSQASERLGKPGRPWPLKHSYLVTSFNAFTRDQQTSGRETEKKRNVQKQIFSGIRFCELSSSKNSMKKLSIIFHTISGIDRIYCTIYNKTCSSLCLWGSHSIWNSPFQSDTK